MSDTVLYRSEIPDLGVLYIEEGLYLYEPDYRFRASLGDEARPTGKWRVALYGREAAETQRWEFSSLEEALERRD